MNYLSNELASFVGTYSCKMDDERVRNQYDWFVGWQTIRPIGFAPCTGT